LLFRCVGNRKITILIVGNNNISVEDKLTLEFKKELQGYMEIKRLEKTRLFRNMEKEIDATGK